MTHTLQGVGAVRVWRDGSRLTSDAVNPQNPAIPEH
jgi:hypothetical protein